MRICPLFVLLVTVLALSFVLAKRHHHRRRHPSSSSPSTEESDSNEEAQNVGEIDPTTELPTSRPSAHAEALTGKALVDFVNSHQLLWRADPNGKFQTYDESVKWRMMGVNHVRHSIKALKQLGKTRLLDIDLPANFDSREKWPACASIRAIRDQSSCGSCWAFGAVEAMSDRTCIASGGDIQVSLSADDLLSCCGSCGFGCDGGEPLAAWKYWVKEGIVTGSNFTLRQGCRPYPFPPCEHHSNRTHYQPCKHDLYPTPKCEKTCQDSYTTRQYSRDKFYGKSAYAVDSSVKAIQNELYVNGPLEVAFEVYEDFLSYQGGVYFHAGGKLGGGHAVKLIGWGSTENGVPYWVVANSWNTDWGEDGFFRILRGKDECGIESGAVGGVPDLTRSPRFANSDSSEEFNAVNEEEEPIVEQPRHPHRHHRIEEWDE